MFKIAITAWGKDSSGGTTPQVFDRIVDIIATENAFASITSNGAIFAWGNAESLGFNGPKAVIG